MEPQDRQQIRNFTANQRTTLAPQIIHVQDLNKHQLQPHTVGKGNLLIQILQCILSQQRKGRNSEKNLRNSPFRNTRSLKDQEVISKIDHCPPPHLTTFLKAYLMQFYSPGISSYISWKIWKGILKGKKAELERMSKHQNQWDMTRMLKLSHH